MSLNLDKIELEFVSNILNNKKRTNKLNLVVSFLFLINVTLYIHLAFSDNNNLIFNLIIATMWLIGSGLNIFLYIKGKKHIKNLQEEQNRLLKKIDYNKYIKTQRKNKLRKIKKIRLKW